MYITSSRWHIYYQVIQFIPKNIREGGDQGIPVMMSDDAVTKKAFEGFAAHVVRSISMRNANISAEKIAETV